MRPFILPLAALLLFPNFAEAKKFSCSITWLDLLPGAQDSPYTQADYDKSLKKTGYSLAKINATIDQEKAYLKRTKRTKAQPVKRCGALAAKPKDRASLKMMRKIVQVTGAGKGSWACACSNDKDTTDYAQNQVPWGLTRTFQGGENGVLGTTTVVGGADVSTDNPKYNYNRPGDNGGSRYPASAATPPAAAATAPAAAGAGYSPFPSEYVGQ